jgi:hypothetical protein
MAHYKVKTSRLRTRNSTTEPEWLRVGADLTKLVNAWSGRNDLVVYGGADSAEGIAPAAYYADISEIEVNLPVAFGLAKPESIGDFTKRETQTDFLMTSGVIYHEALHAKHTHWDIPALAELLDNPESHAFMGLEESRIEAKGAVEHPQNLQYLRASALELALEEVDSARLASMQGEVWQVAQLALLSLARVSAGILTERDVVEIRELCVTALGEELLEALEDVWTEFQSLHYSQTKQGATLAKKWVELLRQADPEGEPSGNNSAFEESDEDTQGQGQGQGQQGEGQQSDSLSDQIRKTLEDSATQTEMDANDNVARQEISNEWSEQAKQRAEEAKQRNERKQKAKQVFEKPHHQEGSGSHSRVRERRSPTGRERASAVQIAKALEKAKYRERSVHTRKTELPQGRLVARNLIQNRAMESKGLRGELPAWKQKVRKHTDDPTLTLGVMVDISGSMGSAMEAMGATAWIMSEAGRRIQAKTAMVYYGNGVFPTLKVGQKLDQVTIYSAPDSTEKFGQAWEALDGALGLTYSDGVRLLVIVSDGYYTSDQQERCKSALKECKRNGVAVLWLVPKECHSYPAKNLTAEAGWGVVADELDVSQIASVVGKTATQALARVGES